VHKSYAAATQAPGRAFGGLKTRRAPEHVALSDIVGAETAQNPRNPAKTGLRQPRAAVHNCSETAAGEARPKG
jgi:hypothetical protein